MNRTNPHKSDEVDAYLNELRIDILARLGLVNEVVLEPGPIRTELDAAILRFASKVLGAAERQTLFFAFLTQNTWEDVQILFLDKLRKELKLETVKTYATRISHTLGDMVTKSEELKEWLKNR